MTDAKLTVELLDKWEGWAKADCLNTEAQLILIAAARDSLELQAYDELRRDGISVGAAQQAWHMAHAACGALGLIYEETAPADIAAAVYAESAPSAPSQPAESPWVAVSERLPKDDRLVLVWNSAWGAESMPAVGRFARGHEDPYDGVWNLEDDDDEPEPITHWMPLPSPPEPTNGR